LRALLQRSSHRQDYLAQVRRRLGFCRASLGLPEGRGYQFPEFPESLEELGHLGEEDPSQADHSVEVDYLDPQEVDHLEVDP